MLYCLADNLEGQIIHFVPLCACLMTHGHKFAKLKPANLAIRQDFTAPKLPAIALLIHIFFLISGYSHLPSIRCEKCLSNRYGLEQLSLSVSSWLCPVCSGNCNCSLCRKKVNRKSHIKD